MKVTYVLTILLNHPQHSTNNCLYNIRPCLNMHTNGGLVAHNLNTGLLVNILQYSTLSLSRCLFKKIS